MSAPAPLTLLPATTRTRKPWKNGGGVTSDVLVVPEGAGLDDFVARISIAEVATSGPFSRFAGIDRTTALLAGAGFDLMIDGQPRRLAPGDAPLTYPGDVPATAELIDGASTDLNVMTRRGRTTHRLEDVSLKAGASVPLPAGCIVVWQAGDGAVAADGAMLRPGSFDAVRVAAAATVRAVSAARFFVIDFADADAGVRGPILA
jgi:environmental stress-induced protein Ves